MSAPNPISMRVQAVHPHWRGHLILFPDGMRVIHEEQGNTGKYELEGDVLRIYWDRFEPEVFRRINRLYVHEKTVALSTVLNDMLCVRSGRDVFEIASVTLNLPNDEYGVAVRVNTSDTRVFEQLFVEREYDSPYFPVVAHSIIDLGANIGLSAVFFARKYIDARVYCVEPDPGNFALMRKNVDGLGERVACRNAAAWETDGTIVIQTEDELNRPLEAWGVRVGAAAGTNGVCVEALKMATLLEDSGFSDVDILKVDIEGAEFEVFSAPDREWLNRIKFIAIETHDRFKSGSERAVREALAGQFEELPQCGENLLFRRLGN